MRFLLPITELGGDFALQQRHRAQQGRRDEAVLARRIAAILAQPARIERGEDQRQRRIDRAARGEAFDVARLVLALAPRRSRCAQGGDRAVDRIVGDDQGMPRGHHPNTDPLLIHRLRDIRYLRRQEL